MQTVKLRLWTPLRNAFWTLVAASVYKDLIPRLWAGINSVNTWSQCMYWMTLKNLDNCSEQPPSLIEQVHHLALWTLDVGLLCCSTAGVTHMFVRDWKQSTEKTLDPMVCGLQRVSVCLSANNLDPRDTPTLHLFTAPGLTGLPPSWRKMKVSYFPPLGKQ